jgi:hypothetical protein
MKKHKYILILLFASFTNILFSQVEKGKWMIEGQSLTSEMRLITNVPERFLSFGGYTSSSNVKIGYFVSDHIMIGGGLKFSYYNTKDKYLSIGIYEQDKTSISSQYGIEFQSRYHFLPHKNFTPFVGLNLEASASTWQSTTFLVSGIPPKSILSTGTYKYVQSSALLGFDYFLTPNVAFEGSLEYNFIRLERATGNSYSFGDRIFPQYIFTPNFGMKIFLSKEPTKNVDFATKYLQKDNFTVGLEGNLTLADYSSIYIKPSIGYFLIKNWYIGLGLGFYNNMKDKGSITLNLESRYYIPFARNWQILSKVETGGGFGYSWFGNSDKSSIAGYGIKIGAGVNKFIGQGVAIETLVSLDINDNYNKKTDVKPSLKMGIQYFFKRR